MRLYELINEYVVKKIKPSYSKFSTPVYLNPDDEEWDKLFDFDDTESYRAYLNGNDIYVWRMTALIHYSTQQELNLGKEALPVIVFPNGNTATIMVTDSSARSKWFHRPEVYNYIKSHPFFNKKYKKINVTYYDEHIVGDWRLLGN